MMSLPVTGFKLQTRGCGYSDDISCHWFSNCKLEGVASDVTVFKWQTRGCDYSDVISCQFSNGKLEGVATVMSFPVTGFKLQTRGCG